MYYYRVKENSVIENMMTEDKKNIDNITEKADRFCEKYGFRKMAFRTYPVIEVEAVKDPKDDANLELFKKPNKHGEYIPRKRFKSVYAEFQAIGKYRRKLTSFIYFIYANSETVSVGEIELTWGGIKKPFVIGYSHKINQDIIDENLIEITKSEFTNRKEEE